MSDEGLVSGDLLKVRQFIVNFHVLREGDGLYLIDTGFIGGVRCLDEALHSRGWAGLALRGILLTHGHLDHVLNVKALVERSGAWVAAPRLDADHYAGHADYTGLSRITGGLESVGRAALSYRRFVPDRLLDDGDSIGIWQGLRAVHLPGHTPGHTGYYCQDRRLLFTGDLFASYAHFSHLPPRILNQHPEQMRASLEKALALDLEGVIPSHCDEASPEVHLERLRRLAGGESIN